eukprot:8856955-Pyramimonas_sp.AAC.1
MPQGSPKRVPCALRAFHCTLAKGLTLPNLPGNHSCLHSRFFASDGLLRPQDDSRTGNESPKRSPNGPQGGPKSAHGVPKSARPPRRGPELPPPSKTAQE